MPDGLCECGCGGETQYRFVRGHSNVRFRKGLHRYRVDEATGCWLWTGPINPAGYGSLPRGGGAHRAMWIAHRGAIASGLHIDHLCRCRACVNPEHMELVTCGENTRRGDLAKLTWDDVRAIRTSTEGVRATARRYGVDHSVVSRIRRRLAWWPEPAA
jgi:hypothetical protein